MFSSQHKAIGVALGAVFALSLAATPSADAVTGRRAKARKRVAAKKAKAKAEAPAKPSVTTTFMAGTPLFVVRQAFKCALEFNHSRGFRCYLEHNVENNRNSGQARAHLKQYQWRHFLKYAAGYVAKGKQFGLTVTRQVPATLTPKSSEVKFFLRNRHRDNPAPITLRLEGNKWRIYQNSL